MKTEDLLQTILTERPNFHLVETEINRSFDVEESLLPRQAAEKLKSSTRTNYGIGSEVLSFIAETIDKNCRTLETGAGCSTLVFAIKQAKHIAVTPSRPEIELIEQYAKQRQIPLDGVCFVPQSSEHYLPQCETDSLDLVLLDGKHAFPWPIIDWFYTADRLRKGGTMIVDDVQIRSVSILTDFLLVDSRWQLMRNFSSKTLAFKKMKENVHDVAWHMQQFTVSSSTDQKEKALGFLEKIRRKMKRIFPA